jgi:Tfp pilus assembly protein PilN
MPDGVWLQSLSVQTTPAAGAAAAAPAARAASPAGGGPAAGGIGSLQVTAVGLDYPAVAGWLRSMTTDPALSGVAVGALTQTQLGTRAVVNFISTATITPSARSDRPAQLAAVAR